MKLFLRDVKQADMKDVYDLSNAPYVRENSLNPHEISIEEHREWFKNMMESNDIFIYVVASDEAEFLGQVRFKKETSTVTVSISLRQEIIGKGYSVELLKMAMEKMFIDCEDVKTVIAYVLEENESSKRLFQKAGYEFKTCQEGVLEFVFEKGRL